jgi:hypothetical protein
MNDGSSIQNHSVGPLFPYVIYAKQCGEALKWGVLSPNGDEQLFIRHETAVAAAQELQRVDRKIAKIQRETGHSKHDCAVALLSKDGYVEGAISYLRTH